jgi:hypothetical protein
MAQARKTKSGYLKPSNTAVISSQSEAATF